MSHKLFKKSKFRLTIIITMFLSFPASTAYAIVGPDRAVLPTEALFVGLVEQLYPEDGWLGVCSASLIAPQIMLTAAHLSLM